MDDLNKKIALRMQEVSVDVWTDLSSLLPEGSYTSNQVYKFLQEKHDGLTPICDEEITIEVDTFKCSAPKYIFFHVLHQFEKMASIPTKNRKRFIRQVNSVKENDGTTVAFNERHIEYKEHPKQKRTESKKENVKPITPIFMAAERYEGTQPFYVLSEIENGDYKVKGAHDSDLMRFIRTAAHFIRQDQMMQAEFCTHCREQLSGKDWRSLVPLQEIALAEMFESFLAKKGIEEIPDVEFEDIAEEVEPESEPEVAEEVEESEEVEEVEAEEVVDESEEPKFYTFCITGTLDKSRKYYQEQIEMRGWRLASKMSTSVDILVYGETKDESASNKVKQAIKHGTKAISAEVFYQMLDEYPIEAEEVVEEVEAEEVVEAAEEVSVRPMAIEREIVPTLELETSDGTLIIAGNSYFQKLYDEELGCFRSDVAEAKFNEIDAFIDDELIQAEELDYAAITDAVCEFMEEVSAS